MSNTMERVYNFASGPVVISVVVLESIHKNVCNYNSECLSVMEICHPSKTYVKIIKDTREDLKKILNLNDNFEILLMWSEYTVCYDAFEFDK